VKREEFAFAADGESVFLGRRMPYAWHASAGRLALVCGGVETTIADFAKNPNALVRGSTAVDGLEANLLSEAEFLAGTDATDALVVLEPCTEPHGAMLTAILDRGGRGLVTDFTPDPFASPDVVPQVSGCCENDNFAADCETRPFVAFAVSPRTGLRLRALAAGGGIRVRLSSAAQRSVGTTYVRTELLPGRRAEEVWLLVDRCAPEAEAALAAAREAVRALSARGTPVFGVRLVVADDPSALAAYVAQRGADVRRTVIGAGSCRDLVRADAVARCSGAFLPAYANVALVAAASAWRTELGHVDDLWLSDPTVGVPTVGLVADVLEGWLDRMANPCAEVPASCVQKLTVEVARRVSEEMDTERLTFHLRTWDAHLASAARFVPAEAVASARMRLQTGTQSYRTLSRPARAVSASPWRDYAAGVLFARASAGLPVALEKLPKAERPHLLKPLAESPVADLLSALDGRRNLAMALRTVELVRGCRFDEASVGRCVRYVCQLAEAGYLVGTDRAAVTQADAVAALRAVGVEAGDVLLVHSSLTAFGHVVGGARTLLAALREAVGEAGTVLLPAFASSLRVFDVTNKLVAFRPFDPKDPDQVAWVGRLPVAFLRDHPDAPHSGHCTNAWTGFGPKAAELLAGHPFDDCPASSRSPLAKARAAKGKVVFLGADVKSCTFLHYLEDRFDLPGVAPALASVKGSDGRPHDVVIARHFPGPRDFYKLGEEAPFFREAKARGLQIRRARLGLGQVKAIELEQLAHVGEALLSQKRTRL